MPNEKQLFKTMLYQFFDEFPDGIVNVTPSEINLIDNNEIIKTYSVNMLTLSSQEFKQITNEVVSQIRKGA